MSDGSRIAGATPGDDLSGLLQSSHSDRRFRDVAETETIDRAYQKYIYRARRKKRGSGWFTSEFCRKVHHEMLGEIWEWAGKYRTVPLNIGVDWHSIPEQMEVLVGDFAFWDSAESAMSPLEVAARLQNRLTRIHPFKNGNGRHSRFMTDIFFHSRAMGLPKWPQIHLEKDGDRIRDRYIAAMKEADLENFGDLMTFIQECLSTQ